MGVPTFFGCPGKIGDRMVMPIYDDNPFRLPHRPIVTWSLIGLNLLMFLIEIPSAGDSYAVISRYGVTPAAFIGDGAVPGALPPVLTLVTYMFLHADAGHIFGNMIFLWVFGDDIEEALGRTRFLLFYLLTGALAALAYIASNVDSEIPLIGASGAIAGIVVAYVMLRPCARVTVLLWFIPLRIAAYWVVGAFAVTQFVHLGSASKSDVAYWCHVGGMVAGGALFMLMRPAGLRLFECIRLPRLPEAAGPPEVIGGARGGWH
jgi:membrane associated rhomboid family serine protease